jgi:hypothetical protein
MAAGWFNLTYNQMAIIERLPESLSNLLPRFEKIYRRSNTLQLHGPIDVGALTRIFHPFLLRRPKSFRGCVMFWSTILGRKNTPAVVNLTCLATKGLILFLVG